MEDIREEQRGAAKLRKTRKLTMEEFQKELMAALATIPPHEDLMVLVSTIGMLEEVGYAEQRGETFCARTAAPRVVQRYIKRDTTP